MNKTEKRKAAKERRKRKNLIITSAILAAAVVVILLYMFVVSPYMQGKERVYTNGNQMITLRDNGTFSVRLFHGTAINGTYTESTENEITTVSFTSDDRTVTSRIIDDILTLPAEWDDGHGHGSRFKLK